MHLTSRRSFLKRAGAAMLGVAGTTTAAAGPAAALQAGRGTRERDRSHVELVNRGELSVLFGDCTRHGMGGPGYCGIWSLWSIHDTHSAFVNSLAGFLFNGHRGQPVDLRRLGDHQVEFRLTNRTLDSRIRFTVREPYYVDCETTVVPLAAVNAPYLLLTWASYVNSPREGDIFFLCDGQWVRVRSPRHGIEATYCPTSLHDTEDDLRHLRPEERSTSFHYGYSEQRFSESFYFGRIRSMALAFFFDTLENIRFTISPSGGGGSIIPDRTCPAWDWLWLIPRARRGRAYTLHSRMVYKWFAGREDIHDEFKRWRRGLSSV